MSAATARAGVEVQYRATGVEAVKRSGQDVGRNAEQMSQKFGGAARQMSGALEMMARQGKVTGESMKMVAQQGAEMAFMFGKAGPIAGAIAILGVAMFSFWDRTRREMAETARKGIEELEKMAASADLVGVSRRQQHLFSGNPYAMRRDDESDAEFLARSGGLQAVRRRRAQLRGEIGEPMARLIDAGRDLLVRGKAKEYKELLKAERELSVLHEQGKAVLKTVTELTGRQAANAQEIAKNEKRTADATREQAANRALALKVAVEGLKDLPGASSHLQSDVVTMFRLQGATPGARRGMVTRRATTAPIVPEGAGQSGASLIGKSEFGKQANAFLTDVVDPMAATLRGGIAATIGAAVGDGFRAAFSGEGLGATFQAFGNAVLAGIGGIMQQMGAVWLEYGLAMSSLTAGLFNPMTSGPTAIAIGALLVGLGAALGALGGKGGRGGRASSASVSAATGVIDRGMINPANPLNGAQHVTPTAPVTVNATILSPNDPTWQRQLSDSIALAQRRGF